MKLKILFLIVFFCLLLLPSQAQRFNGGILTGFNVSQVDGDRWSGYYQAGLVFGAFVNTEFREKFGGQLELKYSPKGSSNTFDPDYIRAIKLRYIDVPVLITYQATERLKIETGLSFNYLFSAKYYEDGWFDLQEWDVPPSKFETSFALGFNYKLREKVDVNVRYGYSLFPVRSRQSGSNFGQGAWFNNVLTFALYFHLGQ